MMHRGSEVDAGGLTRAAESYIMAVSATAAERDRNRRLKGGRQRALDVIQRLKNLAQSPIDFKYNVATDSADSALREALDTNEEAKQHVLKSLADLESQEQKAKFEAFLRQYAPDLLQTYRIVLIDAMARGREIAGAVMFLTGEDYTQFGFSPIPKPAPPGTIQGPTESAEDFFK